MKSLLERTARAWRGDRWTALRKFEETGEVSDELAQELGKIIQIQKNHLKKPAVNKAMAQHMLAELQHMRKWVLRELMQKAEL
jgi:hypothetical protein